MYIYADTYINKHMHTHTYIEVYNTHINVTLYEHASGVIFRSYTHVIRSTHSHTLVKMYMSPCTQSKKSRCIRITMYTYIYIHINVYIYIHI